MNRDFVTRKYLQDNFISDSQWMFTVLHHFATKSEIIDFCENSSVFDLSKYKSYEFIPKHELIKGISPENAQNGIYLYGDDGYLYKSEFSNIYKIDYIGVAIITDDCRFIIKKEHLDKPSVIWGANALIGTMDEYNTPQEAKLDYNGFDNTEKIYAFYGENNTSYAAYQCLDKIDNLDYLGSAGEMYAIYQNIEEINNCLSRIDTNNIKINGYYWTSTQTSSYSAAWAINFRNGALYDEPKDSDYNILPLTRL